MDVFLWRLNGVTGAWFSFFEICISIVDYVHNEGISKVKYMYSVFSI
jgi:hypothetical protein